MGYLQNATSYLQTPRATYSQHELPADNTSYLQTARLPTAHTSYLLTTRATFRPHQLSADNTSFLQRTSRDTWSIYTMPSSRLLNPDLPIFLQNAQTLQNLVEYVIAGRVATWVGTLLATI